MLYRGLLRLLRLYCVYLSVYFDLYYLYTISMLAGYVAIFIVYHAFALFSIFFFLLLFLFCFVFHFSLSHIAPYAL